MLCEIRRRTSLAVLVLALALASGSAMADPINARAHQIDRLHSLVVLHRGEPVVELVRDGPGGRMIYSTGATHLAAAALVEVSGQDLAALAREWLGEPLNIRIPDWLTDPHGVHFGGNEMLLSPRALARIGELYRQGGRLNGRQIVSSDWIERSWDPNGRSPWTGDDYGFGWFITDIDEFSTYYGRGFGGPNHLQPQSALPRRLAIPPATRTGRTGD